MFAMHLRLPFPTKRAFCSTKRSTLSAAVATTCALGSLGALSFRAKRGPPRPGSGAGSLWNSDRRVTNVLLVSNVTIFALQLVLGNRLLVAGAKVNELIRGGEYYRFVSAAFLHGDILHLGFNCNALHQLGPLVEGPSGHLRFLAVYLGSAVAGTALSFFCSPHPSIGASGAIFGVAGALAVFARRHKKMMGPSADSLLRQLRDIGAINLMYGVVFRRIDNWGHMGGLLGGAALSYLLGPKFVHKRNRAGQRVIVDDPPIGILATRKQT